MIGVRGQEINVEDHPPANLVYLLDVSGSMREELWLIKPAFHLLTRQLRPEDTLSIVVYAGRDAVVLDGARGDETDRIMAAIDELESGGGTNGAMGIERAYQIAQENFVMNGNNRVILATDGDFNMGISDDEELVEFIEEKADEGVFLTIYGFSQYGNSYQDEKMEELSNHGNGTYFFIDGVAEAQRAFMHSLSGTLLTIAKDVKLQVQFNPDLVKGYRLIGYDNRLLNNRDFNDDSVDAGELGNSEEMTAFYELVMEEEDAVVPPRDRGIPLPLNPAPPTEVEEELEADHLFAVRMRYKLPDEDESQLFVVPAVNEIQDSPSLKFSFASTVAHLGLTLRKSVYVPDHNLDSIEQGLSPFGDLSFEALEELRTLIDLARTASSSNEAPVVASDAPTPSR
jgi:Ca-activated chloride channel family protein